MSLGVVVMDRDVKLARLYSRFLSDHGFQAETAPSESECQEILHQRLWDALVLDCEIPQRGRKRLLAWSRIQCSSLPVILTTWSGSPDSVRRLVVPPVVLCLRKFFPLPALLDAIRLAARSAGTRDSLVDRLQFRAGNGVGSAACQTVGQLATRQIE
jgi:DNA-binding response OmpR family regulator